MASVAVSSVTPSISNSTLPGFTTATHASGAPLPFPIRVSGGFFVIGLSGKTRIQTLPPRLMKRVMAIRAALVWRFVTQPHSSAFNPNSPNESEEPRHALPVIRPRCCFRNLTFFGINIALLFLYEVSCPPTRWAFLPHWLHFLALPQVRRRLCPPLVSRMV